MKVSFKEENHLFVATLEGRLDTAASEQAAADLAPLNDCSGHDIVIDCTRLEYISSSGLRILLSIRKNAQKLHSKVTLKGVNDVIYDVLRMTGFTQLFEIERAD